MARVGLWPLLALFTACGSQGGSSSSNGEAAVSLRGLVPGPNPFIVFAQLSVSPPTQVTEIAYTVQPRPGTASKPVRVS